MALKLVIDKLEDVDEGDRTKYVERDGKFHLDVDGLDIVTREAVQAAIKKSNEEAKQARLRLKPWETLGVTPEDIQKMRDELTELQSLKEQREMTEAEKKGQWDELKKQMNEKHAAELSKRDELIRAEQAKIGDLKKSIEHHLMNSAALAAISEHKGIAQLLQPVVLRHIKVEQEGNKFDIKVVDERGEPRVNGKGDPLTLSEFVGEMQTDPTYGRAFEGTGSSGSGTRPVNNGGGSPHPHIHKKSDLKTEADRAKFVDQFGLETYKNLPW